MNIKHSLEISPRSEQIDLDHDEETDYSLLTREPVEELVIETFAVVWREAHTFPRESRVAIWLFGIVYRLTFASLRSELSGSVGPVEADFGGEASERNSRPAWLLKDLMRLSFRERVVVELVYGLGLSCDEIAFVMQCSTEAVKAELWQARGNLVSTASYFPAQK